MDVEFEFKEYSETDMHKGILILGMGHNSQSRLDDGFELINLDTDNINLSIDLAIPETINEIDNKIIIDFHVIVAYGVNIQTISDTLISTVKYQVEEFTGLKIEKINIFVEGVRVID